MFKNFFLGMTCTLLISPLVFSNEESFKTCTVQKYKIKSKALSNRGSTLEEGYKVIGLSNRGTKKTLRRFTSSHQYLWPVSVPNVYGENAEAFAFEYADMLAYNKICKNVK